MIKREAEKELRKLARLFKTVAVVGPRQSGKTTLTRFVFKDKPYVNLENPDERRFATDDPRGFLSRYPDGAVFDEIHRVPQLFSYLQQNLDEDKRKGKFILTGSNNFLVQENISQSLAGRIGYLYLLPFSISEVKSAGYRNAPELIFKGFYPPVFEMNSDSSKWYLNYIGTYIERDVRQIKNITDLNLFDRFLRLCASRTGQLLNMNNLAMETGIDNKTVNSWIGILETSFILFRLFPHHRNFSKRIVKMPKLYFYDTGLVCTLLGIKSTEQLIYHPLYGSLFENMVVAEIMKYNFNFVSGNNIFFWRDNVGHEIDIIIDSAKGLFPIEIKSGQTVTDDFFQNILFWQKISNEKAGVVVYGGDSLQKRSNGINFVPWNKLESVFATH
jgi:uncharacterized protein